MQVNFFFFGGGGGRELSERNEMVQVRYGGGCELCISKEKKCSISISKD